MPGRRSVSVLVHAPAPLRVLLLRRPASRAAGWQPVTGRVEPGDHAAAPTPLLHDAVAGGEMPALAAACLREIREETGLPEPAALLDLGLETSFTGYDGATYHARHVAARYATPLDPPATPEHEEWRWAEAGEALGLLRWEDDREALRRLVRLLGEGPAESRDGATLR